MAEAKKKRVLKKTETVRDKASKSSDVAPKTRRIHKATGAVRRPISAARRIGKMEYHPIKLPDNRVGRFLTKSRRVTPRYLRESWTELKLVTWPNRKETTSLTLAVVAFALVFSVMIGIIDYGLDKLFKALLLN